MGTRYVIEVTAPDYPGLVLHVVRYYRAEHRGAFTLDPGAAMTWARPEAAWARIDGEQCRLPNELYGDLDFHVREIGAEDTP